MQSAVKAPTVLTPSFLARELLSSGPSIQAVMVMGGDGKVLAHERSVDYGEFVLPIRGSSSVYLARDCGLIIYLRASGSLDDSDLRERIEAIIRGPFDILTT